MLLCLIINFKKQKIGFFSLRPLLNDTSCFKRKSFDELNATAQKYISAPYFYIKQISGDSFCNHLVLGVIRSNFYSPFCKEMLENLNIMECRGAEISAVNLEGFPSF